MTNKKPLKLKRHETFSIREGWIEKGINYSADKVDCFSKENGTLVFGLGSNMVKSLRYWLSAAKLATFRNGEVYLSHIGGLLHDYDPFLNDIFSWWIIHLLLVTNEKDAPVFNAILNLNYSQFDKDFLKEKVCNKLIDNGFEEIKSMSSLESDISVFLKSYYSSDYPNPEDNMNCPLSRLNLFSYDKKKVYTRKIPLYSKLDYRIVYLSLFLCCNEIENKKSFNVEDIFDMNNSPLRVLNLSKSSLFRYLDDLQKEGYLQLNKTGGLNVVYLKEIKPFIEVIRSYYEEVKNNVRPISKN
ncbi:MAG: DUF4007 family protein [Bacilli bacterium]